MPDPQPISWGSISQGMPLFSTNKMPVSSAARSSTRGLPPLGLGGSSGNSGSTTSQSSSVTSSLAMVSPYPLHGYVRRTKRRGANTPYQHLLPGHYHDAASLRWLTARTSFAQEGPARRSPAP